MRHVVFDNCDMRGVDLSGAILIGTDFVGSDTHASTGGEPTLVIRGPRHSVVATPSKISIGCAHGDMQNWLDYYRVIGAERGYNLADVDEYGSILRDVAKLYGDGGLFGAR